VNRFLRGLGQTLTDLLTTVRCPDCLCNRRTCETDPIAAHCIRANCPACLYGCDHPDHIHPDAEGAGR
jgi:hypothetical protein